MDKKLTFKMKVLRFTKKYKKHTTRHTMMAMTLVIFLLFFIPVSYFYQVQSKTLAENGQNTFTASFVGDIAFNDYYDKLIEQEGTENLTMYLKDYLAISNYATGNIIGSITDKETQLLKDFNLSTVTIKNQTINDMQILDENGIIYVGQSLAGDKKIVYQQINGKNIATIGTSEGRYISDLSLINKASLNADLVIVNINWNDIFSTLISNNQSSIAKAIGDAGADIIIGHNNEVLQPIEIYNGTIIMYSLGNFLHGESYSITNESALVQYIVGADGSSKILEVIPVSLVNGRPKPALSFFGGPNRYNIFKILTRDLPDNMPWTNESGVLTIELN